MESLQWLFELAVRAKPLRLVINGSFVTDVEEPNDVDCLLLVDDDYPLDRSAATEILKGLPFLDIQVAEQFEFDVFVFGFFASDRVRVHKGMIEVQL